MDRGDEVAWQERVRRVLEELARLDPEAVDRVEEYARRKLRDAQQEASHEKVSLE